MITAYDLARSVAVSRSKSEVLHIFDILIKILTHAKEFKKSNKVVQKFIIDPDLVETFILQYFTKEHIVDPSTDLNDFLYTPKELNFNKAILDLKHINHNWLNDLNILIKVKLPTGTNLCGKFCDAEIVEDIKLWISHSIDDDFFIAEAENPSKEFNDVSLDIGPLNLHRKLLIVKTTPGDFGRHVIEETELQQKNNTQKTCRNV